MKDIKKRGIIFTNDIRKVRLRLFMQDVRKGTNIYKGSLKKGTIFMNDVWKVRYNNLLGMFVKVQMFINDVRKLW